jgi:hypothetical protein
VLGANDETISVASLVVVDATSAATTETKQITQQDRYGSLLYFVAFGVSFLSEGASIALCLCVALFIAFREWLTDERV